MEAHGCRTSKEFDKPLRFLVCNQSTPPKSHIQVRVFALRRFNALNPTKGGSLPIWKTDIIPALIECISKHRIQVSSINFCSTAIYNKQTSLQTFNNFGESLPRGRFRKAGVLLPNIQSFFGELQIWVQLVKDTFLSLCLNLATVKLETLAYMLLKSEYSINGFEKDHHQR